MRTTTTRHWIYPLATVRAHICKHHANVEGALLQAMRGGAGAAKTGHHIASKLARRHCARAAVDPRSNGCERAAAEPSVATRANARSPSLSIYVCTYTYPPLSGRKIEAARNHL